MKTEFVSPIHSLYELELLILYYMLVDDKRTNCHIAMTLLSCLCFFEHIVLVFPFSTLKKLMPAEHANEH